ncbi:Splicing factor 3A subunit 2 [Portunus trituberculatus]|uniref:Splicing factor 3A subunit 2 n=1 Tax=Portunus trituberculatus TaxID=210409 RepID=A0A5B7CR05_PORTR|nr:Splicing factor 3A subunit 2 [Portunus trituberculatus]
MEDEDDYGSSAGSINTASFVTACLEKIVVSNPEIAEKFSNACMSLLNKSVGTTCDSDYEYEESSCGSFADQSGRISARNWRNSRSPSFSGGPPGPRNYRDRHEGSSRRIVVEYSQSPSPDRGHCSRYDQKRHTAPSSPTLSTKRRYSFNHHKSGREEDPKTSVIRSIKKIRKQCEEESNSTVRRALLALLKVHQKECDMYLRKPEAHPDYIKEYRVFLDKKSRSIIDLGGDPNDYDFQENWKKYWPTQLARLFRQSWDTKMHKCTSMLLKKGHLSKSLSTSSSKEVTSQPHKKKKGSKDTSEKNSEVKNQEHQKLEASSAAQCKTKKEEMDTELLNILKLLNHIKHKFKDCEASFDSFYQKALSFKQKNLDLSGILSSNLSLLEKIDTKLEETLEDEDLTLIQKAIIKETHERFQCFLKKSKESNSHVMKNYNDRNQVVAEEHHIECLVTDLHPSVVTSLHTKKVIPAVTCRTRTLTEISIQKPEIQQAPLTMTQEKHSHSDLTQPPPPGVTPPPPGVTPPPPGVTPPPLGVTPPPPGVTPPPLGVTPPFQSVSSPPSGVTPLSGTVITSLSHSVTSSINTECAKSPHHTTPAPSCNISIPLHIPASSPGVMPPPPGITPPPPGVTPPPPGVTPPPPPLVSSSPPTTLSHQSLIIVPSQRSFPASKSLPVSNLPKSHDAAPKVTEHPSTTSTSAVQRSKPINNKDIIPVSQKQTQRIHQKSREFLRSTIKDCFLSTSSPIEERNLSTSTEEESITPDSKAGESAASSIPTLTEDILKMFVVKLEDKSETIAGNKSCDELNTSVVDTKPATKKRIKITIPQSSEKKRMPALNPILDDQELL